MNQREYKKLKDILTYFEKDDKNLTWNQISQLCSLRLFLAKYETKKDKK